jgi:hypothetical protein
VETGLKTVFRWFFCCLLAAPALGLYAQQPMQAFLFAESGSVVIGAPLRLTYEVRLPKTHSVAPPDTAGFAAAGIDLLDVPHSVEGTVPNGGATAFRLSVTAYDSGWYFVPPLKAVVGLPGGGTSTAVSPALRFRADYPASALRDTVQMAENRPNREAYPMTFRERLDRQWPILAAILASVALLALVWWLRRRRLRLPVDPSLSVVRAVRSPYETALAKLADLRAAAAWTKGRVPDHYVALSLILREYLEERFEVPALESTTDQLPALLRTLGFAPGRIEELVSFARTADLVKFAKFLPDVLECERALEQVRLLVENLEADAAPPPSPPSPVNPSQTPSA